MVWLGKLFGIFVMIALTNLDILKLSVNMEWGMFATIFFGLLLCFIVVNMLPNWKKQNFSRLGIMLGGETLIEICVIAFTLNFILGISYFTVLFPKLSFKPPVWNMILHILLCFLFMGTLALNGFIRMYISSVQLGIKWRILFLLFWWVPILNLILLHKICRIVKDEYDFEIEKKEQNKIRSINKTCETKYPIVLVHGVFFRDRKCFNYWGRVPRELMCNGAEIFYGKQQSAAKTEDAAAELKNNIMQIIQKTGCEKVNIIAHSKGGLESRYAISQLGLSPYVASLTTINTPHHGCTFVDWLLEKMPKCICNWLTKRYNTIMKSLGDTNPDFYAAICNLTSHYCEIFNREVPDAPNVFYQSVGSKMKSWYSAPFPLNLSYLFVRCFEKENDGLVSIDSMKWGSHFRMASTNGHRGITHGDMIDLNRQNINGFDVREFYVELVQELKHQGF